jgi:dihydrodipicolinate synthase/N-acetylneuraminate lyase
MIQGVWTALPHLWSREQPDLIRSAVSRLLSRGIHGLFVLGTTGRGAEFSLQQRMETLEQLVRATGDANKIVVAISANPPGDVRLLLEHAISVGVKGVAITPPFYGSWTNTELLDWVNAAFGGASPNAEVYLYHIPSAVRTGWTQDLLAPMDQQIGIDGIKDSSGDVHQLISYLAWSGGRKRPFSVMVGDERLTTYCLMMGGSGMVSGLSTAYPDLMLKAYAACMQKDWDAATAMQREINEKLAALAHYSPHQVPDALIELAQKQRIF